MSEDSPIQSQATAGETLGGDGWFTLLLSTVLIALLGGITLLWLLRVVWRDARTSPSVLDGRIELALIPGMQLKQERPNGDFELRLRRAHALYRDHGATLLLLGGHTGGSAISESRAGYVSLLQRGVVAEAMLLEEESSNTLENLRNARDRLYGATSDRYALISNRYHLARCRTLAHGLGMRPLLCAAEEFRNLSFGTWPRLLLEAYYLHWYHTGKLWSQLTGNRQSLARIS